MVEGVSSGNVIDEKSAGGPAVVRTRDRPKRLLPSRVPYLNSVGTRCVTGWVTGQMFPERGKGEVRGSSESSGPCSVFREVDLFMFGIWGPLVLLQLGPQVKIGHQGTKGGWRLPYLSPRVFTTLGTNTSI